MHIFRPSVNGWIPDADISDKITEIKDITSGSTIGWQYTIASTNEVENYDSKGLLISIKARSGEIQTLTYLTNLRNVLLIRVTDHYGRQLNFTYDSLGRISSMTDPADNITRYSYDTSGNLSTVTYPDDTPADLTNNPKKTYVYGEPANTANVSQPNALTGIIDENGVRYATYRYDASGRAISTEHATGGIDKYSLAYSSDRSRTDVTDPLGSVRTTHFTTVLGVVKSTGADQPGGSGCGTASSNITYDANGNLASRTDFNNHKTCYAYDLSRNLETKRIEGLPATADCVALLAGGTLPVPARQITTNWHATYRLPLAIAEPQKLTIYTYYPSGLINTRSEQATSDLDGHAGLNPTAQGSARNWTLTYNNLGQVLTIDGPRTDVNDTTTYTYTTDGHSDLATITNPLGQVTRFADYDANGRARTITAANGVVTSLGYAPRGWLKTLTQTGGTNVETTQYTYTPSGQLQTVTPPDGSLLTYGYDDAQRLTSITDNLGNKITYTLDNIGNRTNEAATDISGGLRHNITRIYDALNRLQTVTGAAQ
jgi:YD repeat-containing protein